MKKPNIIFFVMDAVRARNLSCNGYFRKTSPNIDLLAKNGVNFTRVFSPNNSTDKSLMTILSGRVPELKGERDILVSKEDLDFFYSRNGRFLQEILKENSYKTYWLKEIYGWQKKGIDFFLEEEKSKSKPFLEKLKTNMKIRDFFRKIVHYLPIKIGDKIRAKQGRKIGEKVTNKAIEIINSSKESEPFFMWVDYNDTHIPYNPGPFTGKFKADLKGKSFFKEVYKKNINPKYLSFWRGAYSRSSTFEDIIARYDSAISYNDYLIGKVVDSLKEKGILENTLIFYFSDHGESFDTQGIFFDHHGLYDVCTNVPLIISGPKIPKGKKIDALVQHEDIVPTILDLLEINYDKENFDGKSLLSLLSGKEKKVRDYVYLAENSSQSKKAIRNPDFKYIKSNSEVEAICSICNEIHGGAIELYDLEKDFEEKENISDKNKDRLDEMKKLLETHLKDLKIRNEKRRLKGLLIKKPSQSVLSNK